MAHLGGGRGNERRKKEKGGNDWQDQEKLKIKVHED